MVLLFLAKVLGSVFFCQCLKIDQFWDQCFSVRGLCLKIGNLFDTTLAMLCIPMSGSVFCCFLSRVSGCRLAICFILHQLCWIYPCRDQCFAVSCHGSMVLDCHRETIKRS